MNTEKQARLEILPQNQKDLETQVARIKKTLEKVRDKNISLREKICIIIHEQIIISTLPALLAAITTIALSVVGDFGGGGGTGGPPSKNKGALKKLLDRLADALKRLTEKAVEALNAIVGSVAGAILSLLGGAVGFVAEHMWALTVFVVGFIDW